MPFQIDKNSVRQAEDGFAKVSIGRETHRVARCLAKDAGVSMSRYFSDLIKREAEEHPKSASRPPNGTGKLSEKSPARRS
jgi:hypothetical protein